MRPGFVVLLAALSAGLMSPAAGAEDRHEGYYYPTVTSHEVYPSRAVTLPDSTRARRIAFVVGLTNQQLTHDYPPGVAIFAKGAEAERMIIVALNRDAISSLYQARAMLAQMAAVARSTDLFRNRVEDSYTFLDLLKLLGYQQLTVSDGHSYAHQILIE